MTHRDQEPGRANLFRAHQAWGCQRCSGERRCWEWEMEYSGTISPFSLLPLFLPPSFHHSSSSFSLFLFSSSSHATCLPHPHLSPHLTLLVSALQSLNQSPPSPNLFLISTFITSSRFPPHSFLGSYLASEASPSLSPTCIVTVLTYWEIYLLLWAVPSPGAW